MVRCVAFVCGVVVLAGCGGQPDAGPAPVPAPEPTPATTPAPPPTAVAVAPKPDPKVDPPKGPLHKKGPKPPKVDPAAEKAAIAYVTAAGGLTLRDVSEWNQLATVRFDNVSVAAVDAEKLAALKALRFVGLEGSKDTDALLKQLPTHLPWLKSVDVSDSAATVAGFAAVGKLADLEDLYAAKTKIGADDLTAVAALPKLGRVDLKGSTAGDDAIKPLAASKSLKRLIIADTQVTFEGVAVTGWADLEFLDLSGAPVTDAGLKALAGPDRPREGTGSASAGLPKLEELLLDGTQVTDAGLASLSGLKTLKRLRLARTPVTGRGLDALAKLPALEELWLAGKSIDDAGFRRVGSLAALKKLDLADAAVTDAGVKAILGLAALEQFDITRTPLTDAAARDLAKLKGLKQVTFARTKVTKSGADALRAARPDVVVTVE